MANGNISLYKPKEAVRELQKQHFYHLCIEAFLQFFAGWCFLFGFIYLILKQIGLKSDIFFYFWLILGFLGTIGWIYHQVTLRMLPLKTFVAAIDGENKIGGLLMAEYDLNDGSWNSSVAKLVTVPKINENYSKKVGVCVLALVFAIVCAKIPVMNLNKIDKKINLTNKVSEILEQVDLLERENVINAEEKKEIKAALDRIEENSDKNSPSISFEALDQLQEKMLAEASNEIKKRISDIELLKKLESLSKEAKSSEYGKTNSAEIFEQLKNLLRREGMNEKEIGEFLQRIFGDKFSDTGVEQSLNIENSISESIQENMQNTLELAQQMSKQKLISDALSERLKSEMNKSQEQNGSESVNNEGNSLVAVPENGENSLSGKSSGNNESGEADEPKTGNKSNDNDNGLIAGTGIGKSTKNVDTQLTFGEKTSDYNAKFHDKTLPDLKIESVSDAKTIGIGVASPEIAKENFSNISIDMGKVNTGIYNSGKTVLPKYRNTVKNYFSNK